ncbi:MAG: C40 family peptidase [Nocardiopsaceae bacterium]|nr:C40 family peptidase [Nocardiopsaceae bacterium]
MVTFTVSGNPVVKRQRPMTRAALTLSAFAVVATLGLVPPAVADEHATESSSIAASAVEYAKSQIGKPYRYGGSGPDAFDCSGLVQWAYAKAGKNISRTTYTQYAEGRSVSRSQLRAGDLVFFYSGPSHVGMYIGDGSMIHAPSTGKTIQIVSMSGYYNRTFVGARRMI